MHTLEMSRSCYERHARRDLALETHARIEALIAPLADLHVINMAQATTAQHKVHPCQHIFRELGRARRCYEEAVALAPDVADEVRVLLANVGGTSNTRNVTEQEVSRQLDKGA